MGQGKRGAEVSRKADNAGKEEHKCCEAESAGYILCMFVPAFPWITWHPDRCTLFDSLKSGDL
jgi:hypothetical protein